VKSRIGDPCCEGYRIRRPGSSVPTNIENRCASWQRFLDLNLTAAEVQQFNTDSGKMEKLDLKNGLLTASLKCPFWQRAKRKSRKRQCNIIRTLSSQISTPSSTIAINFTATRP